MVRDVVREELNSFLDAGLLSHWCGCGMPEEIDKAMLTYLSSGTHPYPNILKINNTTDLFCAYIADSLGWTEHGGSVYGAWLTEEGKKILDGIQTNNSG